MPPEPYLRHPVWSVFDDLLGLQIQQAVALCVPSVQLDDAELRELLPYFIHHLARGSSKKEIYQKLVPRFGFPQHDVVFTELSSWISATERVLSVLYQPALSQYRATQEDLNDSQTTIIIVDTDSTQPTEHTETLCQPSELLCLPSELLDHILKSLPVLDINDVRLTCRQARLRTFPFWSRTYFSTRQFSELYHLVPIGCLQQADQAFIAVIDEYSLLTLLHISVHPQLSTVLSHLIIGVDEIEIKDTLSGTRDHHAIDPAQFSALFQYWQDAASAQQSLLDTGRAVDLLSTAISNLSNLNTVSVSGSELFQYAPYSSKIIHRPHFGMRSYGSSAYQMRQRYVSCCAPNSSGFVDRVFKVVLNSLTRSLPNVTTLQTRLSNENKLDHLDDDAFSLLPLAQLQGKAATFLGGLSELHLDICMESKMLLRVYNSFGHRHGFDSCNMGLRRFLACASNLQSLSLNILRGDTFEPYCGFMTWFCESPSGPRGEHDGIVGMPGALISSAPPPVTLPNLRNLVLNGLFTSPSRLRAVFTKFKTLNSVALSGVYLRHCFLDHQPVAENSDEQVENLWVDFFRGSFAALANLDSLELRDLGVMQYRQDPGLRVRVTDKDVDIVVFPSAEQGRERPTKFKIVSDFGRDALKKLAEEALLERQVTPAQSGPEEH